MEKPITLIYEEFKQGLTDLIHNSGLPPFVVEPVLQSCLSETKNAAKHQYEYEKALYEKYMSEKDDNNSDQN